MNPFDQDEYLKKAHWVWFIILTAILTVLAFCCLPKSENAFLANIQFGVRFVIVIVVSHFAAKRIAPYQLSVHQNMKEKADDAEAARLQKQAQKVRQQDYETNVKESAIQREANTTSLSKHKLVARLGSIDGFIRAVEAAPDAANRTAHLQKAHSVMMTLAAELAAGEISRDALDVPEIRELAAETSRDIARLGLADDRLNRDIVRMFKLKSK
jgi:hypothetical protein